MPADPQSSSPFPSPSVAPLNYILAPTLIAASVAYSTEVIDIWTSVGLNGCVSSNVFSKSLLLLHQFLSRVSILTRDIDIAILSVCLSVRPSVRNVPVSDENGLTHRHSFFTIR